ncbi:MAG: CHAT domain-containing tetratricopeptide repeat protein [Marinoscillum sp.]
MVRISILTLLMLAFVASSFAQSPFKTKKEEKFYNKINDYYNNGDYEKILSSEEDIMVYVAGRNDTVAAVMNFFIGDAYLVLDGDLETSVGYFRNEYELRKKAGFKDEAYTQAAFNLGYILDELGYYKETETIYLELLEIEKKNSGKDSESYFVSASSLLDHYVFTGEHEKGLDLANDLGKKVEKNSLNEAIVLRFKADFYELAGNFSRSEKSILKALEMANDLGMYASVEYVAFLNTLAGISTKQGKIPLAEEVYLEAISILDRLGSDFADYRLVLESNLAVIYTLLGNYDQAITQHEENLKLIEEFYGTGSFVYGQEMYDLGGAYILIGNYEKGLEYTLKAGEIYKSITGEKNIEYVRVLQDLTNAYTSKGRYDKAEEYGLRAVSIVKEIAEDNLEQISFSYYYLGSAYFAAGDLEKAKEYLGEALKMRKKYLGVYHPDYAKSAKSMATLSWAETDTEKALEFYEETFDNYFTQINTIFPILSEAEKSKFYYNNLKPAFEQYNSFIVETSIDNKALIGQMYNNQLATKGLILYATNKVKAAINNSGDSVLIGKYDNWIAQKELLAKLFSASEIPAEIRNKQIDSLNTLANNLEKDLSKSSAAFASTFAGRDLTWQDVRAKLKPGEAAVETIRFRDYSPEDGGNFTDEVYYAALIVTSETQDYPEMVLMRNGKLMETKYLSNYRNAIKYKVDEDFSYRLFWRPIANKLEGIKKVYFSPDGVFNQISIYTLRNPATGNFTLDELEIQLLNNSKDLVAFKGPGNKSGNQSYLFGYPNYNMGAIDSKTEESGSSAASIIDAASEDRGVRGASRGVRGTRGADEDISSLTRGGALPRGLRGNLLRYMRSNQMLALLPGTKKEVNLIDSLYNSKALPATTYLSNDALEDSIKMVKSPRTLHIATHGFFLESDEEAEKHDGYVQNPLLRSGLILAGANSYISAGQISDQVKHNEDGILTAYEAMNLNLDGTELVVLSACETGLGEVKNGEGVYGLQRAFQVAGADAIIMSMWTVDDDATQELMTIFYEEWLSGKDKQSAFITAQKRLKDKWKSPYYWGAFVMVGN